jgi:hypothetical protein
MLILRNWIKDEYTDTLQRLFLFSPLNKQKAKEVDTFTYKSAHFHAIKMCFFFMINKCKNFYSRQLTSSLEKTIFPHIKTSPFRYVSEWIGSFETWESLIVPHR